ncbi:MAG: hypothetical protein [Bacteriophage sp.]|nr:MAG: hypothetical protein [Bacteriophage sp.]
MIEEEKNAIEIVKGLAVYYDDDYLLDEEEIKENESVNKSIELILNLIEKLQKENEELKKDYISKKKLYKHIEMLEKENCQENCGLEKLIDCGRQCSIGCTIKNIKKILEE